MDKTSMKTNTPRDGRGFSLVTMLSIGMIATLIVSGLMAAMLPVYRAVSGDGSRFQLKNFAEASIDYVIAQLNDPELKNTVAPADDTEAEPKKVIVTSNELGLPGNLSATVTISNEMPPSESRLFNPSLSPYAYIQDSSGNLTRINQDWSYFAKGTKSKNTAWRTIVSVVTFGALSETVSVAAQIDYSVTKGASGPSSKPFFQYAGLGSETITLMNNASTFGYSDSSENPIYDTSAAYRLGGDLAAFHHATLDGSNINVGGSLDVPSIDAPSDISAENGGSSTINRYLTVNENAPTFAETNVLGKSNPAADIPADTTRTSSVMTKQKNTQLELAPAPTLPTNSIVSVDGDLTVPSGTKLSGNHYVSSMNMNSGSIDASGASIYVQDTGSTGQVVDITGSINPAVGKSSADFQIWYNGRGKISIKATDIRGTIYAPNAKVEILSASATTKGSFKGAVVARDLTVSNVDLGFDRTSLNTNSQSYDSSKLASATKYKVVGYKEVAGAK